MSSLAGAPTVTGGTIKVGDEVQPCRIPTASSFDGEIPLPHPQMTVSDHLANPFGIQWQRYWDSAPYPDLVKTVPHVACEADDLAAALEGQHVLIEPNSPAAA